MKRADATVASLKRAITRYKSVACTIAVGEMSDTVQSDDNPEMTRDQFYIMYLLDIARGFCSNKSNSF
jgi:hypothetical protein